MRAPQALVDRNAKAVAARRDREANDRLHFLVYGHDEHVAACLFVTEGGEPCSRDYDPLPYPEAEPTPALNYAGTGVGALYGLPGCEPFYAELAGWNVGRSS